MIKTRLFAIMALLGLIAIVFSACSEPAPSQTPPTTGVPAAPNDSIVTGKVINVINVSGDFPWEIIIEVQIAEDVLGYGNPIKQRVGKHISVQTQEDMSSLKKGRIIKSNVRLEGDELTRYYYATNIKMAPIDNISLERDSWILESYGARDNLKSVLDGTEITVIFNSAEGQIKGSAGCNSYFGSYELSNDNLSIFQISNTEMYCMEPEGVMEQEDQYLKLLRAAESYKVQDGKLQINCVAQILIYISG